VTTEEHPILMAVNKLEVIYNWVVLAVQGVSFTVPKSTIVSLLGINGSGKSSTLRAISGFLRTERAQISDGTIEFDGKLLNGKAPHEIARMGVVLVPERDKIFATLTVEENLKSSVAAMGKKDALEKAYSYFPILKQRRRQLAGYLSGGERQMLAIGMALACSPKLLMTDELSLGLAPIVVAQLMELLQRLKQDLDLTVLLVEQNARAALDISDHGYVLEGGRVVFGGTKDELLSRDDIRELYLGQVVGRKSYRDVKQYRRIKRWWL
jgi:branched-chain amino acid transport system ATP-binding protein